MLYVCALERPVQIRRRQRACARERHGFARRDERGGDIEASFRLYLISDDLFDERQRGLLRDQLAGAQRAQRAVELGSQAVYDALIRLIRILFQEQLQRDLVIFA